MNNPYLKLPAVFIRSILFLSILLGLALISEESLSQADPLWREGGTSDADPELERLSRAFERLAEKVQPGVVQIRANRKASTEAGSEVKLTIFRKGEILQRSVILARKPRETEGREG